jgi:hypothetical protein
MLVLIGGFKKSGKKGDLGDRVYLIELTRGANGKTTARVKEEFDAKTFKMPKKKPAGMGMAASSAPAAGMTIALAGDDVQPVLRDNRASDEEGGEDDGRN